MKPSLVLPLVLTLTSLTACGGGGAGGPPAPAIDPAAFVVGVDHVQFPITPGRWWTYVGEEGGLPLVEEVVALDVRPLILGVACTGIEARTFVADVLVDVSTEWFAQDRAGNVWKFGEDAFTVEGGVLVRSPDSWVAEPRGARPWLAFPAAPTVGQEFFGLRPDGVDTFRVTAIDARATVPAGSFDGCTELVENPDDPEDTDIILYATGVGRVVETSTTGHAQLVAFGP